MRAGLSQTTPAAVRRDLTRSLRAQERAIARLTKQVRKLIARDAQLSERFELLDSIPGVGETSAIQLLGELAVLVPISAHGSGSPSLASIRASSTRDPACTKNRASVKPAINTCARASIMPALVAVRHDPHLRGFYQHLQANGKVKMQALVAAMRKLLHAIPRHVRIASALRRLQVVPLAIHFTSGGAPCFCGLSFKKKEVSHHPSRKKNYLKFKRESTRLFDPP